MKVRDAIRKLEQDGWYLKRTRGSHRQFKHQSNQGQLQYRVNLVKMFLLAL
ncbi:MAG: HicA toxin of bacterial toxin-antitoxin [Cyanobacteriota bacterium]|jgi:predicted RNA binding protein YcfA (HicA-like mRNA interferase family)